MIGWYGVPGAVSYQSTKTHVDNGDGPICRARVGKKTQFQWCCENNSLGYLECKTCKRMLEKKQ